MWRAMREGNAKVAGRNSEDDVIGIPRHITDLQAGHPDTVVPDMKHDPPSALCPSEKQRTAFSQQAKRPGPFSNLRHPQLELLLKLNQDSHPSAVWTPLAVDRHALGKRSEAVLADTIHFHHGDSGEGRPLVV